MISQTCLRKYFWRHPRNGVRRTAEYGSGIICTRPSLVRGGVDVYIKPCYSNLVNATKLQSNYNTLIVTHREVLCKKNCAELWAYLGFAAQSLAHESFIYITELYSDSEIC